MSVLDSRALVHPPETFNYSIADGHGDVSSSTVTITVHITPEAVTATPDVNDVNEESTRSEERRVGKEGKDGDGGEEAKQVKTTGPLSGSLGGTLVMAADGP